ncbi:MAG: hypothetical protein QUS35_08700 [bacterium]|nr:hypothetical protein [bacterium]
MEIGKLKKLQRLYVEINRITSIPKEIADLPDLCELNISGKPIGSLPPELTGEKSAKNTIKRKTENGALDTATCCRVVECDSS